MDKGWEVKTKLDRVHSWEVFGIPSARHRLMASQVVAWNPSITRVKSEDTVLVVEDGFEVLTRTGRWPEGRLDHAGGGIARSSLLER
jgi:hypothetical protein